MVKEQAPALATLIVRCGVCRARSWRSDGSGRSDLLGILKWSPLHGFDWSPFERYPYRQPGLRRGSLALGMWEGVAAQPFSMGRDFDDVLEVRCRHRHDLRVSRARVLELVERAADDTIHLPGS